MLEYFLLLPLNNEQNLPENIPDIKMGDIEYGGRTYSKLNMRVYTFCSEIWVYSFCVKMPRFLY